MTSIGNPRAALASRVTVNRACEILGVSRQTLNGYVRAGALKPYRRPGKCGRVSFDIADIAALAAGNAKAA